ncbi:MAG: hypothetical protein KF819_11375 [Labilithrix sp.]|nr:hypothetical protein [Labilithrix sp.]
MRTSSFVAALTLAACGSTAKVSSPHPHDFVLTDGSTYEKNPDVKLAREYWIVIKTPDGKHAMLPRPDGDRRIVEECKAKGTLAPLFVDTGLCASATATTLSRVNGLTASEAMRVSTFLHERLRFTALAPDDASGRPASVDPYPLTSDLLDVCKRFPADREGALRAICDDELRWEEGGVRPAIARVYSVDETRVIADRLNDLYGVR